MNTKKTILTNEQEKYIDDNWQLFTHEAIASTIKLRPSTVSNYCASKGYKKMKRSDERIEDRIKEGPEKRQMKRPPAQYSNRSREEVLNYYESLQV